MGPSGTYLVGDLVQKDGHGGQEPNLHKRESVGVCAEGQGTHLSTNSTSFRFALRLWLATVCQLEIQQPIKQIKPTLMKLTVWSREARTE